jgi:hypothetical protein
MMTSRALICLLQNQNGGKLQKTFSARFYGTDTNCQITTIQFVGNIV